MMQPLGVLPYASPDVRTSPLRTTRRVLFDAARVLFAVLLLCLRHAVLALGYAVLGVSVIVRLVMSVVAIALLFLGGLRWDIVRGRTLRFANWVDRITLRAVSYLRPRTARTQ